VIIEQFLKLTVTKKLMIAVLMVLSVMLAGGTFSLQKYVKNRMGDIYLESVQNLFNSFQEGVKGSLERGQMKSFQKLLAQQGSIPGVLDISLYDKNGIVNLSSSGEEMSGKKLPAEISTLLHEKKKTIENISNEEIRIVSPQIVVGDCIRCHLEWKEGTIGGSLSLSYDLKALNTSIAKLNVMLAIACLFLLLGTCTCIYLVVRYTMGKPISRIIDDLSDSAGKIDSVVDRATKAGRSLADNANAQAASLEETSASLIEIASMTDRNAESASSANDLMQNAVNVMADADRAMDQLNQAMSDITAANEETNKIIQTIEGIAFQTNLLALNASVEAARAGEAGAGFAVVAKEVRNLATRTSEAAKNTTQLLEDTNQRVINGVKLLGNTEKAFKNAVGRSGETATFLEEISTASKDQSLSINHISTAIHELDKVTQQNSLNAEGASEIASDMKQQAMRLNSFMEKLVNLVHGHK
jgi:hypothetical protein